MTCFWGCIKAIQRRFWLWVIRNTHDHLYRTSHDLIGTAKAHGERIEELEAQVARLEERIGWLEPRPGGRVRG